MTAGTRPTTLIMMALVASTSPTLGQQRQANASIVSDRPGLGDGTYVLAPGEWQVELGGTIDAATSDEYLTGSSLVRIGFDAFELRVFVPSIFLLRGGGKLQMGDLGVGVKVPLSVPESDWGLAAGGALTLPSGSDAVSALDPGAAVSALAERSLSERVGLAINVGYGFIFSGVADGTLSMIVTPSFALPGRDDLSAYVGYGHFAQPGDDAKIFEGGLARLDGADRQWDLNAGYDPWAHTWFLGVGLAHRGN